MKPKTLVTLVVAVGCGLVAAFLMKQAQSNKEVVKEATVPVLVAEADIATGKRIIPEWVRFREMPESQVPDGAITDVEQYEDRALTKPAVAGEIIKSSKLGEVGVYGFSIHIPEGMRVATIPVTDADTSSSMLQPDDRIDLLVTYKRADVGADGKRVDVTESKVLLEYVRVWAVNSTTAADGGDQKAGDRAKFVSLLVTPEQGRWVKIAQEKGRLSMLWRNELDDAEMETATLNTDLLEDLAGSAGSGRPDADGGEMDKPAYDRDVADNEPQEAPFDFQEFLDGVDTTEAPPVASAPQPPASLWSIQVGVGPSQRTVDVPLPEPEAAPQPEIDDTAASASLETAGRAVRDLLGL